MKIQPSVADFRNSAHSLTGRPAGNTASLEIVLDSQEIQVHQVHVLRHDKHCFKIERTFQRVKSYTNERK